MTRQTLFIIVSAFAIAAAAAQAQDGQDSVEQPAGDPAQAAESAEQIAARELCMETAAPGAYSAWSIREGQTCENSFTETCRIVRNADGAEASHTCYTPLPMPEAEAGGEEAVTQ